MPSFHILDKVKEFLLDFVKFIKNPRAYTTDWKMQTAKIPSTRIMLECAIFCLLLLYAYKAGFRSIDEDLFAGVGINHPDQRSTVTETSDSPKIDDIAWNFSLGVAMHFPQALNIPLSQPQLIVIQFGATTVAISNITPHAISDKKILIGLLVCYAMIMALSIHFPALLLGGNGRIKDTLHLSVIYIGYTSAAATILMTIVASFAIHAMDLREYKLIIVWMFFVVLPFFI